MRVIILAIFVILSFATIYILHQRIKKNQVCFTTTCFDVELALTPEQKAQGLMFRTELAPDTGMLFVFDKEGDYPFWMKNTKIPLDIIWMNAAKEIVFISKNTPPCPTEPCFAIDPTKPAQYVLEINAKIADRIGLQFRDRAEFRISLP